VVSEHFVVVGNDNYTGGVAGEYPTTATSQAAQLVTDAAAVNAQLANMTTAVTNLLDAANDGTLNMGLYTLISGVTFPDPGNVSDVETAYGIGGTGEAGTLDMSLWIEKTAVVAAEWVVDGNDNYTGGDPGTYPTTLTTQTADKDAIEAATLDTDGNDTTITLPNAVEATAGTALVYEAGADAQHVLDAAFLETNKDEIIVADTDILGEFGVTGTAVVGSGGGGGGALADLAAYEDKTQRRYFRRGREGVYLRVYDVPLNALTTLPKAGAYFPGDTSGPRITSDGVSIGPVVTKGGSHTATRITIMAAAPKYTADEDQEFTHGL
jgi:hypothetical protein